MAIEGQDVLVDLLKQLNKAADKGILGASKQDLRNLEKYKNSFSDITKAITKATDIGFEKSSNHLMQIQRNLTGTVSKFSNEISSCIRKLNGDLTDAERVSAENTLRNLQVKFAEEIKQQKKLAREELNRADALNKKYLKASKEMGGFSFKDQVVEMKFGDSVEKGFNTLAGALTDSSNTTQLLTTGLKALTTYVSGKAIKAQVMQERGEGGANIGKRIKMFKGMGKMMLGVTAVVGGLFAVVKLFQAIEGAGKKINKDLLSSASATDLMAEGSMNAYKSINAVRKDLTSYDFATNLGMTTDEVIQTYGQLNKIGLTMRQLGGDSENLFNLMRGLKEATYGLGIDMSQAGEFANNFRMELGLSAKNGMLIGRMAEEFKSIRDLAIQSSYSTSQFFDKIKDLTDGIGKFNVRTIEAGKILLSLGKVLGPKAAEEFTKGLVGAFGQEGYVDRIKRLMTTNKKGVNKALESSAKATALQFSRDFLGEGGLSEIFSQFGIGKGNVLEGVRKLDENQIQDLIGKLQLSGTTGQGASRQLLQLLDLAGYNKGTMGKVRALGATDVGGTLSVDVQRVAGILGDKSIRNASLGQLKLLESLGYSQEKIEQYGKIIEQKRAEFKAIKSGDLSEEELQKFGLRKEGSKFVNAETGMVVENIGDYLQSQGAVIEDALQNMKSPTLETIMQDSVRATQTSADKINNFLGSIMQGTYDVVQGIYDWLFGSKQSDKSRQAQEVATNALVAEQQQINDAVLNVSDNLRKKEQSLQGKSPAEQRRIKGEIENLKRSKEELLLRKEINTKGLQEIRRSKFTDIDTVEEMKSRARSRGLGSLAFQDKEKGEKARDLFGVDKRLFDVELMSRKLGFKSSRAMLDIYSEEDKDSDLRKKIDAEVAKMGLKVKGDIGTFYDDQILGTGIQGLGLVDKNNYLIQSASESEKLKIKESGATTLEKAKESQLEIAPFNPNDPNMKKQTKNEIEEMAKNSKLKKRDEDVGIKVAKTVEKEKLRSRIMGQMGDLSKYGLTNDATVSQLSTVFSNYKDDFSGKEGLGELINQAVMFNDGIIYQNGTARRISPQDNVVAVKDLNTLGGMGGGGNKANIVNNFYGTSPDMVGQVKKAVNTALRESNVVVEP